MLKSHSKSQVSVHAHTIARPAAQTAHTTTNLKQASATYM